MNKQAQITALRQRFLAGELPGHVYIRMHGDLIRKSAFEEEEKPKDLPFIIALNVALLLALVVLVVTDPRVISLFN